MKQGKLLLILVIILPLFADLSIKQMKTMVEKIKAKRIGTRDEGDGEGRSPFVLIRTDENKTKVEDTLEKAATFTLGAIVNDMAFINKCWVKNGSTIDGYEVTIINGSKVLLANDESNITRSLIKAKNVLKINEEKR